IPAVFVLSAALFFVFYVLESRKERRAEDPLFEFGQLRHRGFRIGLSLSVMATVGQTSLGFVLAIFLQGARDLSPQANGLWQLPVGLCVLVGSQIGSRLARTVDLTMLVRVGLFTGTCSLVYVAASLSVSMSYWDLLPGLIAFGLGFGVCMSQVSNIVLSNVDQDKAGVAGGANGTSRQLGLSVGVAVTGALLTASTISGVTSRVQSSTAVTPSIKAAAIDSLRTGGVRFGSPTGASDHDVGVLHGLFRDSLAHASRSALLVAAGAVGVSFLLSLRLARRASVREIDPGSSELLTH
ncbi:MAG: major facilitator superfamily 1, partial [Ilumatobacteraceae bacterium]|nr:major facilitator superfamily 1 [Ilumatobacteraceae bacterium]